MKFLIFLSLLFPHLLFAHPSKEFSTFFSGFNRIMRFTKQKEKFKTIEIKSLKKELNYYLSQVDQKAPVLILYPGIFGEVDHPMVKHMIEEFEKLPIHLIVLPNLLSASYLGIRQETKKNPWEEEKAIQKEILKTVLALIPQDKISQINLFAESLGTWQALMFVNQDDIKINSISLIWPPLNLPKAITNFDQLIKENQKIFEQCSYWYRWPYALFRYTKNEIPKDLSSEEDKCYGAFIISGRFVESIEKVAKNANKMKKRNFEKLPKTFHDFVHDQVPDLVSLLEDSQILYFKNWMTPIKEKQIKVFMYSSQDDFLNDHGAWDIFYQDNYFKNSIELSPWGGHSGRAFEDQFWLKMREKIKQFN